MLTAASTKAAALHSTTNPVTDACSPNTAVAHPSPRTGTALPRYVITYTVLMIRA